ncbi:hypothetical protein HORIV_37240 [Vreelandella olivaria]|uniref:Signal transduction histidine kinase dimerisation/phosphoacceptor domain-containing protein n=1 Tax=Vreelandella olivaria TaxID=390919 RepID=A0ABN5WXH6_9GAMM|nr:hypothetical protein HORIV_37240 [Halomonas olivaria]
MAHALRSRDQALSRTREAALRNEQVLAVATQAAGTAHELGTPLSTMAVLLKEMQADAPPIRRSTRTSIYFVNR